MPASKPHAHYMEQALLQAQQARLSARPNPAVGCVIVRDGVIVAQGFTQPAGGPHAEVMALREAGSASVGATAYVTLEPCSHFGRTPPCSLGLIEAGISRLVYGCQDANPQVAGQGLAQLKTAGVEVVGPVMQAECEASNRAFLTHMRTKKPLVINKMAMSLDGRTAMQSGESQWITGAEARAQVHLLRAQSCAVITGIGSVLTDNPSMNCRADELAAAGVSAAAIEGLKQPLRVVVDSQLRMPVEAKLLQQSGAVLIATCVQDESRFTPLIKAGAQVWVGPANEQGHVDLAALLAELGRRQCHQVLVEAGAHLSGSFLAESLVDQLTIFMAPKLLGSKARPLFELPFEQMSQAYGLKIESMTSVGVDWRIEASPKGPDN
ncbi:MAG: bifunctional diaminohydroxyphosphoribosylaminopyrimidine deaminase/5-amino-6-(5-phosphoribosylamino)uracil reductase RibD [Oceanospirillaceae bacterium]|jgi:diaminohydroxyphosphoribosylaminopyrimidine deaminase / 5-amino-6-(5-phosphoribosylamino)uracil reductase|nr:bifunctional diaminohydroxyphosphoribosylaminopyrimidine deaminase/5-amino-6-(5-phosphoribosylamino)uracil reductase RibD [Oceanospirillaceae bacterium]MBT6077676.1 bifunctional diaminohydroxyphosphoribosylaminopyrimidine deaminase/5-amino-6-(5-phosphoribosylamino)uracil reductase RibD [Oceanospirillaceae bacterium]MBT7329645.1 bifunctional diaminohydroxyphosphoribosylaminopyrimidine deaminase/5-amino-6-(5-phosphoribosylamino)uracil reductase RibD [Oceanospirillaceae bacterium]